MPVGSSRQARPFRSIASRRRFAHEVLLTQVNSILGGGRLTQVNRISWRGRFGACTPRFLLREPPWTFHCLGTGRVARLRFSSFGCARQQVSGSTSVWWAFFGLLSAPRELRDPPWICDPHPGLAMAFAGSFKLLIDQVSVASDFLDFLIKQKFSTRKLSDLRRRRRPTLRRT